MAMAKLLLTWDVQPGQEENYFDFVTKELYPGLMKLGMKPTDSWFTVYGENAPQVTLGWVAKSSDVIRSALHSPEWAELHGQLTDLVHNYRQRIVRATGFFQL
jgi:hypothetical protein